MYVTFKLNYHLLGLPLASASEILFLKKLVRFYSRDSHPNIDDVDDFVYDNGTSEVCRLVTTCEGTLCLNLLVTYLCILLLLSYMYTFLTKVILAVTAYMCVCIPY